MKIYIFLITIRIFFSSHTPDAPRYLSLMNIYVFSSFLFNHAIRGENGRNELCTRACSLNTGSPTAIVRRPCRILHSNIEDNQMNNSEYSNYDCYYYYNDQNVHTDP